MYHEGSSDIKQERELYSYRRSEINGMDRADGE